MNTTLQAQKNQTTGTAERGRALDFLRSCNSGVLATVSHSGGRPNAAAVYYSVDDEFVIRFVTKRLTQKSSDLARNNQVSFMVYDEVRQTTVQMGGRAVEVADQPETHQAFMTALRSSLRSAGKAVPPVAKLKAGDYLAYKIIPDDIRFSVYGGRSAERLVSLWVNPRP